MRSSATLMGFEPALGCQGPLGPRSAAFDVLRCGLNATARAELDSLFRETYAVEPGQAVYRCGKSANTYYLLLSGTTKIITEHEDGHQQVTAYHLAGDIIGGEGLALHAHLDSAIALEPCTVAKVALRWLETLALRHPQLQHNLLRMMAVELCRTRELLLLGNLRAEQRVAYFLLDIAERRRQRGISPADFILTLGGAEVGNLLGLTHETVSRLLRRFHRLGLLFKYGRRIILLQEPALQAVAQGS